MQLVLDLWRESLRKPALIYVRTTKAHIRSAPLLFAVARFFFSTKKRLTNLNGEQNDTWNLLVSHRICHFRAIQPFDFKHVNICLPFFVIDTYQVVSLIAEPSKQPQNRHNSNLSIARWQYLQFEKKRYFEIRVTVVQSNFFTRNSTLFRNGHRVGILPAFPSQHST